MTECLQDSRETEWYHTPTHLNISDLGTHRLARVEDLDSRSTWSQGPDYLSLPRDQWDITRDINSKNIPRDEMKIKKSVTAVTISSPVIDIARLSRSYDFLIRTLALVIKIIKTHSFKDSRLTRDFIQMAETYLIKRDQEC